MEDKTLLLVGHVPIELSSFLFHFLKKNKENVLLAYPSERDIEKLDWIGGIWLLQCLHEKSKKSINSQRATAKKRLAVVKFKYKG